MADPGPAKGVIRRLLGVTLIFLGMLDSMLSWRAGVAGSGFHVVLIASGITLYAIGAIARAGKHDTRR